MAVVGGDGTGLSGLASQLESQDLEGMAAAVGERLLGELTNRLPAEGGGPFAGASGALQQFSASATVAPADLLEGVTGPLAELEAAIERVPELLGSLREVADAIEAARSSD